jgi:penicillin amidase
MEKDLVAPFVATLAYQHIRTAMVERAAPGKGLTYESQMGRAVVEKLLRERPAGWFADYDEMLLRALVDAVEEGKRMQGRDIAKWQYGRFLRVSIDHPVTHQVPVIGHYFDIGPVPMSGSSSSVKQTTTRLAPSMRMDADLADWDGSLLNIVTGQSGQVLSPHYRDQWNDYYYAKSYPMQFGKVKAKSTLEFRPR